MKNVFWQTRCISPAIYFSDWNFDQNCTRSLVPPSFRAIIPIKSHFLKMIMFLVSEKADGNGIFAQFLKNSQSEKTDGFDNNYPVSEVGIKLIEVVLGKIFAIYGNNTSHVWNIIWSQVMYPSRRMKNVLRFSFVYFQQDPNQIYDFPKHLYPLKARVIVAAI